MHAHAEHRHDRCSQGHCYIHVWKTRKTGPKRKYLTECIPRGRRLAGDGVSSVTDRSLQKKHRRQAASHSSPWSQQDSGITLSTGVGMIGVLEITLIVPTLRVGMPLRTLRVRSRMWRRCAPKLQRYPRHAPGSLNPQSVPFVTRSVTGGIPTRSMGTISVEADLCITMSAERGHDQCRDRLVYNDERRAWDQSCRLQRKRQRYVRFLALCQALFEFCGVVNQYVLPGKGLCRNQA